MSCPTFVASEIHRVTTTWAVATPAAASPCPLARRSADLGGDRAAISTCARPEDHRIVVAAATTRRSASRTIARERDPRQELGSCWPGCAGFFPMREASAETAWSGVFGTTADGLPLIGPVPGHPRILRPTATAATALTFGFSPQS